MAGNGRLPPNSLVAVRGELFTPEAARQLVLLGAAFKRRFGKDLIVGHGYRDYATQQKAYNNWLIGKGSLAAYPGTSNHGWAKAADLWANVQYFGSPEKRWMDAVAPDYGWHPTGNKFYRPEAWHFDYLGHPKITTGPASDSTIKPIDQDKDKDKPKEEEDTMLQFVTFDGTGVWYATDGLTKRPLQPGENQLLVDLGLAKAAQPKLLGANLGKIPDAVHVVGIDPHELAKALTPLLDIKADTSAVTAAIAPVVAQAVADELAARLSNK